MRVAICSWDSSTYCTKRAAEGIAECEHALALDRNLASAHAFIGFGKIFIGRAEETEAHVGEALRLSPARYMAYIWMIIAGLAKLHLGSWDQAVRGFDERSRPTKLSDAIFSFAAALAQLGRLDEAHSAVKAGLALDPAFSVSRVRAAWTAMSDDPTIWPSSSPFSKACARPGCPNNDRRPAPPGGNAKIAAILVADVVGYSRLAGADEERTLARLRALAQRPDRPRHRRASWAHRQAHRRRQHHRVPQRRRRGALRDRGAERHGRAQRRRAARAAHRVSRRRSFRRRRRGERRRSDGRRRQYRGAARRRSRARRRSVSPRHAYRQVKGRLDLAVSDLGPNAAQEHRRPIRVYSLDVGQPRAEARAGPRPRNPARRAFRSSSCPSPISAATRSRSISSTASPRA